MGTLKSGRHALPNHPRHVNIKSGQFQVSFQSPFGACTWSQGTASEDEGFPLELQASSRPPASRGRNAQDQLSAEPRLPFRGAPRTGPSPTAELTGSVCPTRRAAPAKNSALPRAPCSRRGPRHSRGSPSRDCTRSAGKAPARQGLTPEAQAACAALAPQVPRRVEGPTPAGMGAGRSAYRALAWASLPLLGPPAGALCEDTLCSRGKAGSAPSRASASSPPGHSRSPGARQGGPRHPPVWGQEPGKLCQLTCHQIGKALCPFLVSVFLSRKVGRWHLCRPRTLAGGHPARGIEGASEFM